MKQTNKIMKDKLIKELDLYIKDPIERIAVITMALDYGLDEYKRGLDKGIELTKSTYKIK